ncbi:hypothetical protein AAFF_G00188990 [Aldrovandia affinis]|uniref:Cordon-bleu ubiquitin-like domain-containing protein n=1 Tax=Aldrovandia affinis TaxID=143900 RepID=A0AAD7RKA5_9TELE|nr:hypothetical protein AAFF_G00188990 [Aldrovandia affinis]
MADIVRVKLGKESSFQRRSTKGKAPPPPTAEGLDGQILSLRLQLSAMDQKENLIDQDLTLTVVLPGGAEKMAVVHGSKPMMDLLVMLCAKYHLNPSSHTIELISTNRNHIKFKPNALIGALEAEKILLKPKGVDEKNKKTGQQMPEATVRLIINYKKTQKTILRVNPRVPLEELMPAVCEKCEFDQKTSILLRDVWSEEPLDLTKSLNDFGLREVYARDTQSIGSTELPASSVHEDQSLPSKGKTLKEKENKGLFSIFRKSKKKSEQVIVSAPTSPVSNKPRPVSMPPLGANTSVYSSNTMPSDIPKKRRAPLPPIMVSQSFLSNLSGHQVMAVTEIEQEVSGISQGSSAESSLKRTKRKAPLPPSSPPAVAIQDKALEDGNIEAGGAAAAHSPLEEISEQEEMGVSATLDSSTVTDIQEDDRSFDASTDVSMDFGKTESVPTPSDMKMPSSSPPPPLEGKGEDQSNDLSSDGKPAKDPVSDQECTEQTLNTAENAELEHRVSAGSNSSLPAVGQTGLSEENASALDEDKEKSDTGHCSAPSTLETPAPPSPSPQPLTQDSQMLISDQQSSEGTGEQVVKAQVLANDCAASTARYVPAQPDIQPFVPQEVPSFNESARLKRDMATSTEELHTNESPFALPQASKSPPIYVLDSTSKPKPSNELTREYIPKVGLTTYTIVPQKSLEKLRYFEVELTLEALGSVEHPEVAMGASIPEHGHTAISANQPGPHSSSPGGDFPLRNGMVTSDDINQGNVPSTQLATIPSQCDVGVQAAPAPAAKEKKIPPATKPKPGSFRLPLHKRTPGGYVTSAAVKTANTGHVRHKEVQGSPDAGQAVQALEENSFPPPPPPVQWTAETMAGGSHEEPKPRFESVADVPAPSLDVVAPIPDLEVSNPRFTRQWSLPAKDPPVGLSLEKLRSFAAPKPYMSSSHSRFAQAVSSAIKRSQSFTEASSADPQPCRILPRAALVSQYSIKELAEPSRSPEREAVGKALPHQQPDCEADGGIPFRMAGVSDQGEIQDCGDATAHLEGQTDSPTVPDAFRPVSLNGGPTETQPTEVE